MNLEDLFDGADEAAREERRRNICRAVAEAIGVLAIIAGLVAFAWICVATSDYAWR